MKCYLPYILHYNTTHLLHTYYTMASKLPYFFIIGKAPFDKLHDLLLLQVLQYLNNAPFIVSYDKNTRQLAIVIDKHYPLITKALDYQQLHTPNFHTYFIGTKKRIIIRINPHDKGHINHLFWYHNNDIIHHQCHTDSRRKALITRWNNRQLKKTKQLLLLSLQSYSITPLNISISDYIKNTSFRQPLLARSCII